MKKTMLTLMALGALTPAAAFAQNAQMPSGATNPPPGTSSERADPRLAPSTTGTAKPNALTAIRRRRKRRRATSSNSRASPT
jgi:hypothetical protein